MIGTGWCGGIRAETLARSALCKKLHVCEIRPDRLAEIKALTNPATATLDYRDIVANQDIAVVYICTTPEQPISRSRGTACAPASTCCWKSRSPWSCSRPTN